MINEEAVKKATEHALKLIKTRGPVPRGKLADVMGFLPDADIGTFGAVLGVLGDEWMSEWMDIIVKGKNPFEIAQPIIDRMHELEDLMKGKSQAQELKAAFEEGLRIQNDVKAGRYDEDASLAYNLTGKLKVASKLSTENAQYVIGMVTDFCKKLVPEAQEGA